MHAYFANIGIFFDNMVHFEFWQRLRIMAAAGNADKVFTLWDKTKKNRLTVIVNLFLNLWR